MASEPSGVFHCRVDVDPGCTTIALMGELDLAVIDNMRAALDGVQLAGASVVIDLDALTFMDSTGLRLLIELKHRVESDKGTLVLRNVVHPAIRRVLDVSGMTEFFSEPLAAVVKPALKTNVG